MSPARKTAARSTRSAEPLKPRWFQMLLALADRDRHGLDIVREVRRSTEGAMRLWPGTLYGALDELAGRGWIVEVAPPAGAQLDGNPRFFHLTGAGRDVLQAEIRRLERVVEDARARVTAGS
jgi:DNA-binding PadR family transcriptional regulator